MQRAWSKSPTSFQLVMAIHPFRARSSAGSGPRRSRSPRRVGLVTGQVCPSAI
jgi:hypothetical protein